jgi:hypothetical protein
MLLVNSKKAIRIKIKLNYNAHTDSVFRANKILLFDKLLQQNKLVFFHSIEFKYAPPSFDDVWSKILTVIQSL